MFQVFWKALMSMGVPSLKVALSLTLMVTICLPSFTSLSTDSQKSLLGAALPSKSTFQQPPIPPLLTATGLIGAISAELSELLPLLEKPLKSGPMLPSGRVTFPPFSRSAAGFSLMLMSLDRSLPASWPLAVSGPVAPPPPQAVRVKAAAIAAAPPILVRFLMVFPSLLRVVMLVTLVMDGTNLRCMMACRVVDYQHVLVQLPVREEAGEALI